MTVPRDHLLLFHLGPVQGFIAEARRTRDLWTGSFILSWLSGLAMQAVVKGGGKIVAPDVDRDPLFKAISGKGACEYLPSLPNHFKAEVPANFDPEICRVAIFEGWRKIADAVFGEIMKPCLPADADPARWQAQVAAVGNAHPLWDIYWVKGPKTELGQIQGALERRKVWRNLQPVEASGGDFCTMMPRFRELSGYAGASKGGGPQKRAFWETLRTNVANTLKEGQDAELLEIRPGEHLSPIALTKRLMPRLKASTLRDIFGWLPPSHAENVEKFKTSEKRLSSSYRPSTAALAVTHWLVRAHRLAPAELAAFHTAIESAASSPLQTAERFRVCAALDGLPVVAYLDGKLFDDGYLDLALSRLREKKEAERKGIVADLKIEPGFSESTESALDAAIGRLRDLYEASSSDQIETVGKPSDYYAILKADGDSAGKILSDPKRETPFIKALAAFSGRMADTIAEHNGELIYAGGDDLLALLPIEDALPAAVAVRDSFAAAVDDKTELSGKPPTISVAVLFVKSNVALGSALEMAGELLDRVAKAENGRDSLAIRILRGGGEGATWVSRWSSASEAVKVFTDIAEHHDLHRFGSNRFVYGLHSALPGLLVDWRQYADDDSHGDSKPPPKAQGFCDISSEAGYTEFERIMRGIVARDRESASRKLDLGLLKPLIRRVWADRNGGEQNLADPSLDGLMILKFLCKEWRRFAPPPATAAPVQVGDAAT